MNAKPKTKAGVDALKLKRSVLYNTGAVLLASAMTLVYICVLALNGID